MTRTTIKDVAEMAGVSVATVSRVLSGKREPIAISEQTIENVQKAAEALNYSPNALARSLRSRRTNIIGLIITDIVHSYFPEITRGIEAFAYQQGYDVILCDSQEDAARERKQVLALIGRQCDGVLIVPSSTESLASLELLRSNGIPFVLIDRHLGSEFDSVATDSRAGARTASKQLLMLGHRRIAHIRGPIGLSSAEESVEGYMMALNEAGINDAMISGSGYSEEDGYKAMEHLLALPTRPTAVFAANDPLAIGALQAVEDEGLCVPKDVSLIGSGNLSYTHLLRVPLTTLDEHPYLIGQEAASLLSRRLGGDDGSPKQIRLESELMVRDSCGQA